MSTKNFSAMIRIPSLAPFLAKFRNFPFPFPLGYVSAADAPPDSLLRGKHEKSSPGGARWEKAKILAKEVAGKFLEFETLIQT